MQANSTKRFDFQTTCHTRFCRTERATVTNQATRRWVSGENTRVELIMQSQSTNSVSHGVSQSGRKSVVRVTRCCAKQATRFQLNGHMLGKDWGASEHVVHWLGSVSAAESSAPSNHDCYLSVGLPVRVSRFGLAVSRGTSVRIRFGSPFSSKVVVLWLCPWELMKH